MIKIGYTYIHGYSHDIIVCNKIGYTKLFKEPIYYFSYICGDKHERSLQFTVHIDSLVETHDTIIKRQIEEFIASI